MNSALADHVESHNLDVLLRGVRIYFASQNAGWAPTVGKNRVLGFGSENDGDVAGQYQIVGGGDGLAVSALYQIVGGGVPFSWRNLFRTRQVIGHRPDQPGAGIRVGVVDTKLTEHPWFAGAVVAAAGDIWSTGPDRPHTPASHHAAFVSGLILKEAPGAQVYLNGALDVNAHADSWRIATTMAELNDDGIDVLNLSLGCATEDGKPPLVLEAALNALGPETLVVAAAGNHGDLGGGQGIAACWPAACDGVIAVGALDTKNEKASFSPDTPWIDALAPGVNVLSTFTDRRGPAFATWSGTSFAAATVSGAIAAAMWTGGSSTQAWDQLRSRSNTLGRLPMIATPPRGWPVLK